MILLRVPDLAVGLIKGKESSMAGGLSQSKARIIESFKLSERCTYIQKFAKLNETIRFDPQLRRGFLLFLADDWEFP
jgi:hypothetical protein